MSQEICTVIDGFEAKDKYDLIYSLKGTKKKKVISSSSMSFAGNKDGVSLSMGSKSLGTNDDWKNWMVLHVN